MEQLVVSRHARARMDERNIGRPTLEAVLRHGEPRWSERGLRVVCELLGYTAVVDPLSGVVVTVFERRMAS